MGVSKAGLWCLTILWLSATFPGEVRAQASGVKKAFRQIREGDLDEAYAGLRSLRLQGKADFGVDYVLSLYFLSPYQKTLKLDSSYSFCLSAIEKFKREDASGRRRYQKLKIDSTELFGRKDYLDSLGFSQAERLESEAAYQYFLEKFPQSTRAETAQRKRASLAFQQARQQNSYDAFMAFLEKFPDAGEARSAKEISDLLVFENTAKKGKIKDWELFIEKNPNNPYVVKAQNRVYELSTLYHKPESYYRFIQSYPENPNTSRAWEWIFHLDKGPRTMAQMVQRYPGFPELQFEYSFRIRDDYVIPFIERGRFGVLQKKGQTFIAPRFDSVPEEYRCEPVSVGFIKLFRNRRASLFSFDSLSISDGEYDNAEPFADGIVKVFKSGKQGLLHLSGYPLLGARYESIQRLTPNLLSIQQGSRYYLFTTKGQKIDIQGLDEVIPAGNYVACRLGKRYALLTEYEILKSLQNENPELIFRYSAIRRVGGDRLLLYTADEVNFLTGSKVFVLKIRNGGQVEESPWGIRIIQSGQISLVDTSGNALPGEFESHRIFGSLAIARQGGYFGLVDRRGATRVEFTFDTLMPLLRHTFLARKGNRKYLVFEDGRKVPYTGNRQPEVLRYTTGKGIFASYFIVVSDSLDRRAVFNNRGRQILPFAYDQISLLDQHLFSVTTDRRVGLADTLGNLLLKPSVSGVSPVNREYVCVARGKSFSIYNPFTRRTVGSALSGIALNFGTSRSLFIVRVNEKAGVMDMAGKMVVPPVYEEIRYWNPTRCLVRKNGFWYFFMIESRKELVKAFKSIRVLMERENEIIYEVEADKKVGIESTLKGEIAPTDSDEVIPFESPAGLWFFAGRRVQSSSVYNLSYIDQNGELMKTQLLTEDEYEKILCD